MVGWDRGFGDGRREPCSVRASARLGQVLSSAQHAEGHLQEVGVGERKPRSTRPTWNAEPRLSEADTQSS
jgi:hypothetical protein